MRQILDFNSGTPLGGLPMVWQESLQLLRPHGAQYAVSR
jgi:hypothetical protein